MKTSILSAIAFSCIFIATASGAKPNQAKLPAGEKKFPAIEFFADVAMGLISTKEAEKDAQKFGNFQGALKQELLALKGDLLIAREVKGNDMVRLVNSMEKISSTSSVRIIGKKKGKAYIEYRLHMGEHTCIVSVCAPLKDLPEDIIKKF